jgi:hypothetical protein
VLSLSTLCYALAGVIVFMFICLWAEKDSHSQTRRAWVHAINNSSSDRSKLARSIEDLAAAREELEVATNDKLLARKMLHAATDAHDSARVTLSDSHRAQQARLAREIESLIEANATIGAEAAEAHLKIERVYAFLGGIPDVELQEPTLKERMKVAFKDRYGDDCLDKEIPSVEAMAEADPEMQAFARRIGPDAYIPYGAFIAQGTEGQPICRPHPDAVEPTEPAVIPFVDATEDDSYLEDSVLEDSVLEEELVDPLEEKIDHLLDLCQQHRHFGESLKSQVSQAVPDQTTAA